MSKEHHGHRSPTSKLSHREQKMEKDSHFGLPLTALYVGISAALAEDTTLKVALAIHDTIYLNNFSVTSIELSKNIDHQDELIAGYIIEEIEKYEHKNLAKFIGAGLPVELQMMSPSLCSRLWLDLDIVPIVLRPDREQHGSKFWDVKQVDEQADSMARKCIMHFGPLRVPLLQVGFRGVVEIDAAFRAVITAVKDHQGTCGPATWDSMMHYAQKLRSQKLRVAFFSSTPQGGGVALMRHALVRLSRLLNVDLAWYVPKPRPGVFRITKNIHNILQGVSDPDLRISDDEKRTVTDWTIDNAHRYWLSNGGPLSPSEEGGAHIIMIDDPQMSGLIPYIKKSTQNRPVLYRSHIQIRSDLTGVRDSPQADVWDYLWDNIQHSDMFISHPIPQFVPENVPREKVAYMPATTDWIDGLNKPLNRWDTRYYGQIYNMQCHSQRMAELAWPARKYIAQVARFDPSKGIPTVIEAYAEFRRMCDEDGITDTPQLCICGNGSVDDPDASLIFGQAMDQLETSYPDLIPDCSIMRLEPNDQLLNTIISNAHVVLQLSTREGFEVNVSEALHTGRPVIATRAGGIPLQVQDGVNGYLVEPGDWRAVAAHLRVLFTDSDTYKRMSTAAGSSVSDELGTVGNALSWYYLAAKWAEAGVGSGRLRGDERWVNDMAREEAGQHYAKGENRLPRESTQKTVAVSKED